LYPITEQKYLEDMMNPPASNNVDHSTEYSSDDKQSWWYDTIHMINSTISSSVLIKNVLSHGCEKVYHFIISYSYLNIPDYIHRSNSLICTITVRDVNRSDTDTDIYYYIVFVFTFLFEYGVRYI
jgi:hypothetical protein